MNQKPYRFQFFLPNARLLTEQEVESLAKDRSRAEAADQNGLWIEIPCPDSACLDDVGNLTIPGDASQEKETWRNAFCPEGECELLQSTDLP